MENKNSISLEHVVNQENLSSGKHTRIFQVFYMDNALPENSNVTEVPWKNKGKLTSSAFMTAT